MKAKSSITKTKLSPEIPDLSQWRFVKRKKMRGKTVGDWDEKRQEVQVWDGLDPKTALRVWIHELIEMALCKVQGVSDEIVLKWDRAHGEALEVENQFTAIFGEDPVEYEKRIVDLEAKVKV